MAISSPHQELGQVRDVRDIHLLEQAVPARTRTGKITYLFSGTETGMNPIFSSV